jgi:hypothetical protein
LKIETEVPHGKEKMFAGIKKTRTIRRSELEVPHRDMGWIDLLSTPPAASDAGDEARREMRKRGAGAARRVRRGGRWRAYKSREGREWTRGFLGSVRWTPLFGRAKQIQGGPRARDSEIRKVLKLMIHKKRFC